MGSFKWAWIRHRTGSILEGRCNRRRELKGTNIQLQNKSWGVVYRIGNIVNIIISLYGNRW